MSRLRRAIVDFRIGPKFSKAARDQKKLHMLDQPAAHSLPPVGCFDPNTFKKGNRLGVAAVGVGADRDFGEPDRSAVLYFGNKAPGIASRQQ